MSGLCGADPAVALSVLPFALSLCLVFQIIQHAGAMLIVVAPVTDVSIAVGEVLSSLAVHLASSPLAVVLIRVSSCCHPLTMPERILPLPFVLFT